MTKFGSIFSATDTLKKAPGEVHDAGVRTFKNSFDLTVDGGTSEPMKVADLPPGCVVEAITIRSDQNLSGINFTLGTAATANKYMIASAGPNASAATYYPPLALALTATTDREELFVTPSGNMPNVGTMTVRIHVSKR